MCNSAQTGSAVPTVLIENERTRVTQWFFPKRGDNTGWHRHDYDYVFLPVQDGVLEIKDAKGAITRSELKAGVPYFRDLGVEHDVLSSNDVGFAFIEVESPDSAKG